MDGPSNGSDWWKYVWYAATAVASAFAFFFRRELHRYDADRQLLRKLELTCVTRQEFTLSLAAMSAERQRMHNENRETLSEIKGLMSDGLEKLEGRIDKHEEINREARHELNNRVNDLLMRMK